MVSTTVKQSESTVKTDTSQRLVFRKPIVGGLVEATLVRGDEGGGYIRVQVDGEAHTRSIHITDVQAYIVPPVAIVQNAPRTNQNAPISNAAPKTRPVTPIKSYDARKALDRYLALAAERCVQLEGTREYYRIPATWTDSSVEIAKAQRAYNRASSAFCAPCSKRRRCCIPTATPNR